MTIEIGDKITARYYEMIVAHGGTPQKDVDNKTAAVAVRRRSRRDGVASADDYRHHHRHRSKVPSITFTGPRGWTYSSRVQDTDAFKVKVGDVDTPGPKRILSLDTAK